jgi:hypothetical protein
VKGRRGDRPPKSGWESPRACGKGALPEILSKGCSSHELGIFLWKAVEKGRFYVHGKCPKAAHSLDTTTCTVGDVSFFLTMMVVSSSENGERPVCPRFCLSPVLPAPSGLARGRPKMKVAVFATTPRGGGDRCWYAGRAKLR